MFNAKQYLEHNGIPFATEGKNVGRGWLGVHCPFCRDNSFHGGFNLNSGAYSCWRCGKQKLPEVIAQLSNCSRAMAINILKQYSTKQTRERIRERPTAKSIKVPGGELLPIHRKYLVKRNFDPDELIEEWGILGTGPVGPYKFRIVAPIQFDNKIVSFQGRDITGKSNMKYKACPSELEMVNHKNILYGIDKTDSETAIVVEGVFDVWRMGSGAVATFGTKFLPAQVLLLARKFKHCLICYDREPEALRAAHKLAHLLAGLGVDTTIAPPPTGDPGSLDNKQVFDWKDKFYY